MRIVLDTNIWLDWLVFDDPGVAPIRAAHSAGRTAILVDAPCDAELERVLGYDFGKFSLAAAAQAECLARCRAIATRFDHVVDVAPGPRLPACSDPDDQKFLELALAAEADLLLTKDRALLELARRALPFRIVTPKRFSAALAAMPD